MTKADLKTGMFGVMSTGDWFVIVNGIIVYEHGGYDNLDSVNNDLFLPFYTIDILVKARSFTEARNQLRKNCDILYNRNEKKETVMTIAEIEKKLGVKNLRIKGE